MAPLILSSREKRFLRELKKRLHILVGDDLERLLLFGSKARGGGEPGSDLDVAVVVRRLPRRRKRQIWNLFAELEVKHLLPVSAFVVSTADFDRLRARERRIALDIEAEGIPI